MDAQHRSSPGRRSGRIERPSAPVPLSGTRHSAPPPSAASPPSDEGEGEEDERYRHELGERLRYVRRSRGLRLQDVEDQSDGRFKAVVVGSYERGDRSMSAQRLAGLAAFYGIPVAELLPDEPPRRPREKAGLCVAVDRLRLADDPATVPLRRLVQHVQWLRGDYNGRYLSLRDDDLQAVAVAVGIDPQDLGDWLAGRGLLAD